VKNVSKGLNERDIEPKRVNPLYTAVPTSVFLVFGWPFYDTYLAGNYYLSVAPGYRSIAVDVTSFR